LNWYLVAVAARTGTLVRVSSVKAVAIAVAVFIVYSPWVFVFHNIWTYAQHKLTFHE
jgi:hypothetical protein